MQGLDELNDLLNSTARSIYSAEELMCWGDIFSFASWSEEFWGDLLCTLFYLAATDKEITSADTDIINGLFELDLSTADYADMVREVLNPEEPDPKFGTNKKTIPDIKFEDRVPLSVKTAVLYDATHFGGKQNMTGAIIDSIEQSGKFFILNNPVEINEALLNSYVQKLRKKANDLMCFWSGCSDEDHTAETVGMKSRERTTYRAVKPDKDAYYGALLVAGCNIPEGKYVIYAEDSQAAYAVIRNNSQIIAGHIETRGYVELHKYDELCLRYCVAVPIEEADWYDGDCYVKGEYIVGKDMEEGAYILSPGNSDAMYMLGRFTKDGYWDTDGSGAYRQDAVITVKRGQILIIQEGTLSKSQDVVN